MRIQVPLALPIFSVLRGWSRIAPTGRGGFRLARVARRALPRSRWDDWFTTPDCLRLRLDLSTYPDCCMAFGLYELDTARTLKRLLKPGGWFVDCGANVGYFTLLAARRVGPTGRVDAFEPDPLNRRRLEEHLVANQTLAQVRVHAVGLGATAGRANLFHPNSPDANHGMASTLRPPAAACENVATFPIEVGRLDQQLEGVPDVIKIDVEGAEVDVVDGAAGLLRSARPPKLVIEHNPATAAAAGHVPSELVRRIKAIQPRYRIFRIDWRLRALNCPAELDRFPRECNLLARAD